ncbi:type VI secretion system protein TssA [Pseudomonas lactis]|uniref:type VI secretion system protein TssA n=1 Tax=Pseudomonas TaxID=286 RepID=UPI000BB62366|nr:MULTISPECIES: type VI secretion system protein TssA [Pseudomonas]MBA5960884.1 type VI secretion system protein TssA [Pseudomonas lactis]PRW81439.1 type VI secretion system protein TssA [Pseudomonas fluorescens]PRW82692.1 type VI secretion system protein TssA [Pseudomonas fluorescens]
MAYSEELYVHYRKLARTACCSSSFVGSDVRFSSEFEALEAELGKAQSIHVAGQPDWQKVSEISEHLLRDHSKDLRVAVWLVWALYQRDSFAGLLAGLGLLRDLCELHWEQVYPGKLRTRAAAFGWLVSRLEQAFALNPSLSDQRPLFQALLEHLACLDQLWGEQLGSDAPLLLPIRRQLSERLAQGVSEPGGVATVIAQVKQTTQLLSPGQPINNEKDAHRLLRTLQEQARPLCAWWLRQNATDLRALRLGRTLAWLMLVNYPDANSERVTALRPLVADKRKRYQERLSQGHHADLLPELEVSLAGALFWLDGLRMVWECLDALHANLAMTELEMHLALLLQRLPHLPEYRFNDGTPFADPATGEWIALHVMRHVHKPEPSHVVADSDTQPWETTLQAVMPCLRKDGLKAAVAVLKQGLQAACGDRARFHWRLALARLCVAAGKHELARLQLEELDLQLQRTGLESWEPALTMQVGKLLYRCYELLPQTQPICDCKDALHRRLCHFDLEAVLE